MKTLTSIMAVPLLSVALISAAYAADAKQKQQEVAEKQQQLTDKQNELNHERQKEAAEHSREANQAMQQVSRASKIIGTPVANAGGESLGDINDLVVDPQTGQVVYAVVSFGGVLGVGDKLFAIPWKALHWDAGKAHYLLKVDKAELKNAPGFDKKHWPDSANKWDQLRSETNQFYRLAP